MIRKENYPLEDECLRCDANTYLMDQNNFSACLNCPVGASCAGGDDVTTLVGFWRQPDNWTNNWTKSSGRRSGVHSLRNKAGDIPPFLQRAGGEIKDVLSNWNLIRNTGVSKRNRREMNLDTTHRPRGAVIHRCIPGQCSQSNVCNQNRTGPACSLCPDGWSVTAAGCEMCPPPGDPAMLFLQMVVFVIGGLVGVVGYILVSWTPLMNGIPIPGCMADAILLMMGENPNEEEEPIVEQEPTVEDPADGQDPFHPAGSHAAAANLNTVSVSATAFGATEGQASTTPKKAGVYAYLKSAVSALLKKLPELPKGGISQLLKKMIAQFKSVMGMFNRFTGMINLIVSFFNTVFGLISNMFGGLSWLSEFVEKNKLSVHLKIIVSYVQVLGSFVSFNVEWPAGLTALMNDVSSLMQFNVIELPKMACLWAGISFERTLIFSTAGPVALVILFGLPLLACRLKALCNGWTPERLEAWEKLLDRFYQNVLFGAFLIYPIASLNSLQAFNCHTTHSV